MEFTHRLVYDITQSCFREDRVKGINGILNIAHYLSELTQSDEEPYNKHITTIQEALDFLELYDYEIIPVSHEDYELFGDLVDKNTTTNNRLSYELEEEFYKKAKDFKHESFQLK